MQAKKRQPVRYRTIWISDTHLGSKGARAEALANFLKRVSCDVLYLVGDIVDFWRLGSKAYWPAEHNEVLRRLLKLANYGTRIVLVPGNHDEALRQYVDMQFGSISIRMYDVHTCADGRRLLVTHGDQYDLIIKHSRCISMLGSAAYEWLLTANRVYNGFRRWRGKPYWSLSQYIKLKVKSACTFVSRFQETLSREARERQLDGVVCGHIHKPEICLDSETDYYNCGDWIENCTALVEYHNGEMELIHCHDLQHQELDISFDQYLNSPFDRSEPVSPTLAECSTGG